MLNPLPLPHDSGTVGRLLTAFPPLRLFLAFIVMVHEQICL